MTTEACNWLKKPDKSKIHFNLQCFDSSSQSTYIEGITLQMKAEINDKFLSASH